jgi:hypothetical protein
MFVCAMWCKVLKVEEVEEVESWRTECCGGRFFYPPGKELGPPGVSKS